MTVIFSILLLYVSLSPFLYVAFFPLSFNIVNLQEMIKLSESVLEWHDILEEGPVKVLENCYNEQIIFLYLLPPYSPFSLPFPELFFFYFLI